MTYSIIAHDPESGEVGGAVASFYFAVGPAVLWARPGAGVVITQMMPEPAHAAHGLTRMERGERAGSVLTALLAGDPASATRQLALLDARGQLAAYTGSQCIAYAGHRTGPHASVHGAILERDGVWNEVYEAFVRAEGSLAERLLTALERGEELGGDLRGTRSAALVVVKTAATERPWLDTSVDVRVDGHPEPLKEMRRLLGLHEFYARANRALEMALGGHIDGGLSDFARLAEERPDDSDVAFRHALLLALAGDLDKARSRLAVCYRLGDRWRELVRRLGPAGFLPEDKVASLL
jgi:uncharacterized Ntn-hydrolase superfamily protein